LVTGTLLALPTAGLAASASSPDGGAVVSRFVAWGVADLAPGDVYLAGTDEASHAWELRHWDGRNWSTTAGGDEPGSLNAVSALSAHDIWAVGSTNEGLVVVRGHPDAWHRSLIGGTDSWYPESIMALSDSDVWVLGTIEPEGEYRPFAEHFDGTAWTRMDPPFTGDGSVSNATAGGPNSMWAVGDQTGVGPCIAHWDGQAWKLRTGVAEEVDGIGAVGRRDVWAVGAQGVNGHRPFTTHWDGARWTDGSGAPAHLSPWLLGVAGSSSTNVWAVGHRSYDSYRSKLLIEHWDGQTWSTVPAARPQQVPYELLTDIATSSRDDAWAIGFSRNPEGGVVEQWNGSSWQSVNPER
jgi:hypothetical protein